MNRKHLQKIVRSSFAITLGLKVISNLLQVVAFYAQKQVAHLDDGNLALLNFGVYLIGLTGIITIAFSNWVLLLVSATPREKRIDLVGSLFKKAVPPLILLITITTFLVFLSNAPLNSAEIIITLLCMFDIYLSITLLFPRSILISQRDFFFVGGVGLTMPAIRIVFTLLFLHNGTVWVIFVGYIFQILFSAIALSWRTATLHNMSFRQIIKKLFNWRVNAPLSHSTRKLFSFRTISFNTLLQIALASFYTVDGVLLKGLLSERIYVTYTSYAFLYKFPLFLCTSILIILLGKDFTGKNKKKVLHTLTISLTVIILSFSALFLIEGLWEGTLLSFLGYGEYLIPRFSFVFGGAWLLHTIVYFLFNYLLKVSTGPWIKVLIVLYSAVFITTLYLFNHDLHLLLRSSLSTALIFTVVLGTIVATDVYKVHLKTNSIT